MYSTPAKSSVEVFDLRKRRRIVIAGEGAIDPRYSASGHVLFWRRGVVFAVPFDIERLEVTGAAVPVLEDVAAAPSDANAFYRVASNATLVYVRASEWKRDARVVWVDRTGRESPAGPRTGAILEAYASPDGRMIAVTIESPVRNVWLHDVARGVTTPLTKSEASAFSPIWSKDGRMVYFTNETPAYDIYRIAADGASEAEAVVRSPNDKFAAGVTRDGASLLFREAAAHSSIKLRGLGKDSATRTVVDAASGTTARLSPDDRWIAYSTSPAEGRKLEVFLVATAGGARRQLSVNGGRGPRWTRGGREIVYLTGDDSIMSVSVDPSTGSAQLPRFVLRDHRLAETRSFDVSADGERFLMVLPVPRPDAQPLTVVLNWFTELKRKMEEK